MMDLPTALTAVYGPEIQPQIHRYQAGLAAFRERFGPGPVTVFRAPGRVNLIGEHTDYNDGYVLPLALDRDVLLFARPRPDPTVHLHNLEPHFPPRTFQLATAIPPAPAGDWSNYVRGAAQELARRLGADLPGMDVLVDGSPPHGVPRGAGLSSSSALTVASAVALAHLAGWTWDGDTMARLCSEAEWYVGTRGGIMDQYIALQARRDHALFLDCRPLPGGRFRSRPVPLPTGYRLLVVDSGVRHQNTRNEFNRRVAACRAGVALLRRAHPEITHLRDVEEVDWSQLEPLLPEEITLAELQALGHRLGDLPNVPPDAPLRVRACCRHVWSENRRVLATVAALERGDMVEVGRLLLEAHASGRDDYRVTTQELDVLVALAMEVDGVVGARFTGAGWGGCVVVLVEEGAVADFLATVPGRYTAQIGRSATVFPCRAGSGASLVGTF